MKLPQDMEYYRRADKNQRAFQGNPLYQQEYKEFGCYTAADVDAKNEAYATGFANNVMELAEAMKAGQHNGVLASVTSSVIPGNGSHGAFKYGNA